LLGLKSKLACWDDLARRGIGSEFRRNVPDGEQDIIARMFLYRTDQLSAFLAETVDPFRKTRDMISAPVS